MGFDYRKLKGKIVEIYGTQMAFSKAMNLSERTLSLKLNNKIPWKQKEMCKAIKLLNLNISNIQEYFLKEEVQNNELDAG